MSKEVAGDLFDCPKCGWWHRPSQSCPKSKPPERPLSPQAPRGPERSVAELTAGFRNWEARSQAQPTTYEGLPKTCPGCGQQVFQATNFLNVQWDVIGEDRMPLEEHQLTCKPPVAQALPELRTPRRAGLPYKDSE